MQRGRLCAQPGGAPWDLKPSNILLGPYGETLGFNWGLAKVVGRDESERAGTETTLRPPSSNGQGQTQAGSAIGTPAYMSPEQAEGRLDRIGPTCDVYSLARHSIASSRAAHPSREEDVAEVLSDVRTGSYPRPRNRPGDSTGTGSDLPEGDVIAARGSLSLGTGPGGRKYGAGWPTSPFGLPRPVVDPALAVGPTAQTPGCGSRRITHHGLDRAGDRTRRRQEGTATDREPTQGPQAQVGRALPERGSAAKEGLTSVGSTSPFANATTATWPLRTSSLTAVRRTFERGNGRTSSVSVISSSRPSRPGRALSEASRSAQMVR